MFLLQIWDKKPPKRIWLSWPCTVAKQQSGAEQHWVTSILWRCGWLINVCLSSETMLGVLLPKFYLKIVEALKWCMYAAMSLRKLCPQAFEGVGCTFLHIQCCLLRILQGWQVEKVLVWMQILNEKTAAPYKYTWPSGLCNALVPHSKFWKVNVFQRKQGLVGTNNVKTVETASDKLP